MGADRVMLGVIVGAQGVRGAVRVKSFTAAPEDVAAYGPVEDETGARRFSLRVIGASRGAVVAKLTGIEDRDAAEALKGTRLYVSRAALPAPDEEEFYHADLVGLEAVLRDGAVFGRVRAVHDYGAGDSVEIERPDRTTVLLPFSKAAVPEVDLAGKRIVVDPPDGLLENPPPPPAGEGRGGGSLRDRTAPHPASRGRGEEREAS